MEFIDYKKYERDTMRGKRIAFLCLGILVGFINNSTAQETKEITCTGKVLNARGRPVTGAKVGVYEM